MIQNQNSQARRSKTNFKKSLLPLSLIAVIVAGIFAVQSCKKNEQSRASDTEIRMAETVGTEHGKGLDYVYNYLSKSITSSSTPQSMIDSTRKACLDFINNNPDLNISASQKADNENMLNHIVSLNPDSLIVGGVLKTDEAKNIWDKMYKVVNSASSDPTPIIAQLNILKNQAIYIGNANDRIAILCGIEVARNSLQYWHDNSDKWKAISESRNSFTIRTTSVNLDNSLRVTEIEKSTTDGIVAADMAGAILGAVRGAVVGATSGTVVPGFGNIAGAGAGAAIGGAAGGIGASATAGLTAWISSWF